MSKITLNHEDRILESFELKETGTKQSISELVNDALKACMQEDLQDIIFWDEPKGKDTYNYGEFFECLEKFEK